MVMEYIMQNNPHCSAWHLARKQSPQWLQMLQHVCMFHHHTILLGRSIGFNHVAIITLTIVVQLVLILKWYRVTGLFDLSSVNQNKPAKSKFKGASFVSSTLKWYMYISFMLLYYEAASLQFLLLSCHAFVCCCQYNTTATASLSIFFLFDWQ